MRFDIGTGLAGEKLIDRQQIVEARLRLVESDLAAGPGDGPRDLAADVVRRVEQANCIVGVLLALAHLLERVLEPHDPGTGLGDDRLGLAKDDTESVIETRREVAGEFEVLALIGADRNQDWPRRPPTVQ